MNSKNISKKFENTDIKNDKKKVDKIVDKALDYVPFDSASIEMLEEEFPHTDEEIYDLADFFKMFGDSTRLKILSSLSMTELCVSDIANFLEMSHSSISHQLRILKQAKLVRHRREGKVVYYSLNDRHIYEIIRAGFIHINE